VPAPPAWGPPLLVLLLVLVSLCVGAGLLDCSAAAMSKSVSCVRRCPAQTALSCCRRARPAGGMASARACTQATYDVLLEPLGLQLVDGCLPVCAGDLHAVKVPLPSLILPVEGPAIMGLRAMGFPSGCDGGPADSRDSRQHPTGTRGCVSSTHRKACSVSSPAIVPQFGLSARCVLPSCGRWLQQTNTADESTAKGSSKRPERTRRRGGAGSAR
jgi:hypothetical protein